MYTVYSHVFDVYMVCVCTHELHTQISIHTHIWTASDTQVCKLIFDMRNTNCNTNTIHVKWPCPFSQLMHISMFLTPCDSASIVICLHMQPPPQAMRSPAIPSTLSYLSDMCYVGSHAAIGVKRLYYTYPGTGIWTGVHTCDISTCHAHTHV